MKKMFKTVAIAATATMLLGASACAEDGVIKFGTNPEFPPFEYISANGVLGEYDGIDMALAPANRITGGRKLWKDREDLKIRCA